MVRAGSVARGLLVLVAVVAGGLVGLAAGPAVWSVLDDVGVVAWPVCNDVVLDTVSPMCARPRSMGPVQLGTAVLCATVAGLVAWSMLRTAAATPDGHDVTD